MAQTLSRTPDLARPVRRAVVQLDAVLSLVGTVLCILGTAMLLPAAFDVVDDNPGWHAFVAASGLTLFVGGALMLATRGSFSRLGTREAVLAAILTWVAASLCGALPFMLAAQPMDFTDAVFETVSGLTATGSSVLVGLDQAPRGILAWRFLLIWLGGFGLVTFAVLFLPFLRVGGLQLFMFDLSARPGKFLPRLGQVIAMIAAVYLTLTVLCAVCFDLAGMSGFDALGHAMAAIATGGFSSHDAGFAHWDSALLEYIASLFMLLSALPFFLYIHLLRGEWRPLVTESQVRLFVVLVAISILLLAAWRVTEYGVVPLQALREATFNLIFDHLHHRLRLDQPGLLAVGRLRRGHPGDGDAARRLHRLDGRRDQDVPPPYPAPDRPRPARSPDLPLRQLPRPLQRPDRAGIRARRCGELLLRLSRQCRLAVLGAEHRRARLR